MQQLPPMPKLSSASGPTVARLMCLIAGLAIAAGCSAHSPESEFARHVEDIASSAAASRLVVDRWQIRAVPTAYALHALEGEQKDVREEVDSLGGLQDIDEARRSRARGAAERVAALCGELYQQVSQGNGADAARTRQRLDEVEHQLRGLAAGGAR